MTMSEFGGELRRQFDVLMQEGADLRESVGRIETTMVVTKLELKEQMDAIANAIRDIAFSAETADDLRRKVGVLEEDLRKIHTDRMRKEDEIARLRTILVESEKYVRLLSFDTWLLFVIILLIVAHYFGMG